MNFKDLKELQGNMLSSWSNYMQLVIRLKSSEEFPQPHPTPLAKPLYIWSPPDFITYLSPLHNPLSLHISHTPYIPAAQNFMNIRNFFTSGTFHL